MSNVISINFLRGKRRPQARIFATRGAYALLTDPSQHKRNEPAVRKAIEIVLHPPDGPDRVEGYLYRPFSIEVEWARTEDEPTTLFFMTWDDGWYRPDLIEECLPIEIF